MVKNPFILPEKSEEIIGRKEVFNRLFEEIRDRDAPLVFFVGRIGSGRTFFIQKLERKVDKELDIDFEVLTLTSKALEDLEDIPKKERAQEVVFTLDMFERVMDLDEETREGTMETIKKRNKAGIGLILVITPKTFNSLIKNYKDLVDRGKAIKLRSLNLEEAKKLIRLRLDRVDKNFPDMFSEEEFERIWKQSKGNPRTILLTCASLFKERVQ